MYQKFRKGVFCVVFSLKPLSYLLLHRKWHWKGYEFPKGGSFANEKIENTIVREVKEETGLKVLSIIKFKKKGKFIYYKTTQHERNAKGFSYKLFGCEVKKSKVKFSRREHDGYKWLPYSKALRLLTWPNQRKALKIVNGYIIRFKNTFKHR